MRLTMRAFTSVIMPSILAVIGLSAFIALNPSVANAQVQYVKICPLYGTGFYYIPGTDICLNSQTNDARQQTPGGTWRWQIPQSHWNWVRSQPRISCHGELVKVGNFNSSDITVNSHNRFELTTPFPLKLKKGQYVRSVLYKGGVFSTQYLAANLPDCPSPNTTVLDATDSNCTAGDAPVGGGSTRCEVSCVNGGWEFTGNPGGSPSSDICTYYHFVDPTNGPGYSFPLGCVDTAPFAHVSGTIRFTANNPLPPANEEQISIQLAEGYVGSNGNIPASLLQGNLSVWLCLRK